MFGKRLKSAISVLLSLVLMFSLVLCFTPTNANAATTQAEGDELKEQRNQLKEQQKDIQNTVNSLRGQQDKLIELKTALDEKNAITLQQILNLEEQIALHEELIEQKSVELEKAQDVADEQLSRLKVRIRNMEENGRYNYVAVLFGAESISEFLSLMDDIGDIMKSDRDLENSYKEAVTDLKTVKSEYEEARLELKEQKAELTNLSAQLEKDIVEANAAILELEGDISANSAILSQLNAQDKEMQDKINQKIKELNEQNKPSNPSNPSNPSKPSGSGTLTVWPSYCTYITSVQGNRVRPITGQYGTHGGTDIGASYGSAIYAAGSGTVVTAYNNSAYNGGYGNYAMINHGNGIQTLYAHMSVCSVTVGQTVSAGQTIGYVGSTGRSTGPHLHFEVRVNGSRVDSHRYYPGISFSYSPTAWGG